VKKIIAMLLLVSFVFVGSLSSIGCADSKDKDAKPKEKDAKPTEKPKTP